MARIFRADLFGQREEKYKSPLENDISTTQWTELAPQSPFYLFVPPLKIAFSSSMVARRIMAYSEC